MQKTLVLIGLLLVLLGLLWPVLSKFPIGRLPGDIIIDKPNLKIYFPITTMLLISLLLSLLFWLFRR